MIDNCEIDNEINQDMLVQYANRSLSKSEISQVILHLSKCESCRKEIAQIIAISKQMQLQMVEVPADIKISAFERIPQKEKNLDGIIKSNSIFMPFEILGYTLSPVRKTLKLAMQAL